MVFSIIKNRAGKKQKNINFVEAYNLWDLLKSSYNALERVQLWENYAHDYDLKYMIKNFRQSLEDHIKLFEPLLEKFGIKGPDTPVTNIRSAINSQVLRDQYIAGNSFIYAQESIEMILRAIRTSTTNDDLRELLIKIAKEAINRVDNFVKYLKLKGWLAIPPLYPYLPANIQEKVDTAEAFHLWDHLAFRYDNIKLTQIMYAFANDGDLKLLIKSGLQGILNKQAKILENELNYFGIPLPVHPPRVMPSTESSELLEDDFMFRNLLAGIQGAAIMHAQALKQCTTNDRVRKIFKQLLLEEIDILDKLIKYGNLKGWLNDAPEYGVGM